MKINCDELGKDSFLFLCVKTQKPKVGIIVNPAIISCIIIRWPRGNVQVIQQKQLKLEIGLRLVK